VYELLTREVEVARVDEARQGALVQVVDAAQVPDRPDSAYRYVVAACALLCALPLGLASAFLAELNAALRAYRAQTSSWKQTIELAWATALSGGAR
jgi:tyrosine-protein kinase Etk/Wzc